MKLAKHLMCLEPRDPRVVVVVKIVLSLSCLIVSVLCETRRPSNRVVTTKYGSIRGSIVTLSNRHLQPVEQFLGVPYAGVPMGSLRFLPPVTPPHWPGVRSADKLGPSCPQKLPDISNETEALKRMPLGRIDYLRRLIPFLVNQSEDCLYLNIYAPATVARPDNKLKFPVMVFIHGESYEWNSGNPYDGSVLASAGNVVIVTINFRLGLLGFLPALDGSSRGNYGLMDQVAALHWIQENIPEFGGDSKNVTVFGHGHGAACVNLLMLSPLAKGLFQRAILHSGSALSPWAIARDALSYTRQTARHLQCPTEDNTALVECLRQRKVQDILSAPLRVPDHLTAFGPTIDGVVIPGEPAFLMEHQTELFSQFELMLGVTRVESYFHFSSHEDRNGIEASRRDRLLRTLVRNLFTYHLQEIFLTVVNEYTDWSKPDQHPINVLESTTDAMGDALIVAPVIRTGNFHSKIKSFNTLKTYLYVFTYQTEESYFSQRMGCMHGQDLPYVFGAPLVNSLTYFSKNFTRAEGLLSEAVISYWTNFVKYGNPNSGTDDDVKTLTSDRKGKFEKVNWPTYDHIHQKYLSIGMKPRVRDHYHAHRLSFWLNLIPTLHRSAAAEVNARHHLLEDHDNPATYDGIYRLRITGNPYQQYPTTTTGASTTFGTIVGPRNSSWYTSSRSLDGVFEATAAPSPANITDSLAMIMSQGAFSTALSVTIAIGCSLLILNILIFAGVYYQRDKRKAEAIQKRDYQLSHGQLSCNSTPQSKHAHIISSVPSPLDHLPPSFMGIPQMTEAGTLPSKVAPPPSSTSSQDSAHPEAQPLLSTTSSSLRSTPPHLHHHLAHWPTPNHGPPNPTQDLRV